MGSPSLFPLPSAFALITILQSSPADAQEHRNLTLPETNIWCRQVEMSVESGEDDDLVDAAKERAVEELDRALLAAEIATSGMPFVASASSTETDPPAESNNVSGDAERFRFDVCAALPQGVMASPSPPITSRLLQGGRYAVLPCATETNEACVRRLRDQLIAAVGEERKEEVTESPILLTMSAQNQSDQALIAAFSSGRDRATATAISIGVTGSPSDLSAETPRPLRLSAAAALVAAGLPAIGQRAVAIKFPQPLLEGEEQ